jgi:hypothetical protein
LVQTAMAEMMLIMVGRRKEKDEMRARAVG